MTSTIALHPPADPSVDALAAPTAPDGHSVVISPPSMTTSLPVMFAARSLAR